MAEQKILSMDDIRVGLSEMAQNGEGAQRAQAYRMLMNMQSDSAALPAPLTRDERLDRAARILKAMGREDSQVAYQRAWPNAKTKIDTAPKYSMEHLPAKVRFTAQQIKSLPKLYRTFPEMKPKGGFPTGYPVGYGKVRQAMWCQQTAAKILLDRMQEDAMPSEAHGSPTQAEEPSPGPVAGTG